MMSRMYDARNWRRVAVFLLAYVLAFSAHAEIPSSYRFGVFPYLSAALLEEIYAPVSHELGSVLGATVHFRTSSTFQKFFAKLESQHYDFALIQPFWYPPAVDRFGYLPAVRMREPFTALIMVKHDSPLKNIGDLKGRVIATPPAFVPVVHMAREALEQKGLIVGKDVELRAYKSVDSCFQQVIIGEADACVSPPFAPAVIEEKMKIKLRVLLESSSIPNLSLVIHSRVPKKVRQRIQAAFLGWSQSPVGRRLLHGMKTKQFVVADDAEYDVVRQFLQRIGRQ